MLISPEQEALIGRVFETYLTEHHHGDLLQLMADTHEETHHPVVINAMTLFEANMEVGDYFNAYPNDVLAIFDKVLHRTATGLSENSSPKNHGGPRTTGPRTRRTLHARITGLPVCPELTRDTIPRSRDVGHFLSVTGTVIRTSVTKVLEYERDYMCGKCRHVFTAEADFEQFYTFVQPVVCPNPDGCKSYKFSCLSGSEPAACRDYQEIKIQEQVQRLSVGSIPRSLVVVLEDDLVDGCKSGDDVTVYGVMCQRWKPFYDGARCDVELVLKANNIEVNNQQAAAALLMKDVQKEFEDFWNSYKHDPIAGRNQILLSLCPQVFGMYVIKLAVAMVLAGGVQRIDSSGTKIRGECHMLLVGDPGTGKSQFLKYAAKIMPRSVLTAGIGSTSAGLTVAAVKDGGDWHLEAGALVLSDGGLCCIDEFNSIKEHDRISIHEAMEQQSISVAKAGMVCKLNTRTTILAATNPKGQYDPNEPLSVNVALASPLLSRFDLVLVLLDTRNAEWDRVISSFILEDRGLPAESSSLWSMDKMKAYFSVIKRLQPQVSEEADSILTRYYQLQRQSDGRNAARTTIRMLESLSRLAEAHARLMYRETATIEDAVMAVSVMECSMQGGALLGNVNALLTSFPADPGQQYRTRCQILLEGLNLPLLLQKEMDRLARLKSDASNGSQFDPPASSHQQELRDTDSVNTTHRHDVGSNCEGDVTVESGLDWFHSITPSLARGTASPMLASTQENLNRKPNSRGSERSAVTKQPNCQAEEDILGGTSSTSNHAAVASASEEGNRRRKTNENVKGKSSVTQEDVRQAQRQEVKHPECLGYVFQKVSKKLRDRRLGELNHQQSAKEGGGTHGGRVVSADRETVVLVPTSSTLASGKKCPSNDPVSSGTARRLEKEDTRDRTGTKSVSAVLREKMSAEAETGKELHAKLSGFMFKPRKAIRSAHGPELSARSRAHSDRGPAGRDRHAYAGGGNQKPVSHEDALTDTEKRQSEMSQSQSLSEGGGRRNGLRGSAASVSVSAEGLDGDGVSFDEWAQGQTVDGVKGSDDAETLCRRQRTNTGDESPVDSFTCNPPFKASTCADDPAPSKSGCTKSTVASSTLAKLSGFSFTRTTEPAAPAPTRGDKNPPPGVEKSPPRRDAAGCSRAGKKITAADGMGKVKDTLPPPVAAPHSGREPPAKTVSKCKAKQTEPADHSSGGPAAYQSTVNLKKRKCFELGPPPPRLGGSMGLFSGLSPFGSAELTTDVFDTDWDQELSKKAKN